MHVDDTIGGRPRSLNMLRGARQGVPCARVLGMRRDDYGKLASSAGPSHAYTTRAIRWDTASALEGRPTRRRIASAYDRWAPALKGKPMYLPYRRRLAWGARQLRRVDEFEGGAVHETHAQARGENRRRRGTLGITPITITTKIGPHTTMTTAQCRHGSLRRGTEEERKTRNYQTNHKLNESEDNCSQWNTLESNSVKTISRNEI